VLETLARNRRFLTTINQNDAQDILVYRSNFEHVVGDAQKAGGELQRVIQAVTAERYYPGSG